MRKLSINDQLKAEEVAIQSRTHKDSKSILQLLICPFNQHIMFLNNN